MTGNSYLAFTRGLVIQLVSKMTTFSLCSNVNTVVPDSLNSYYTEQLPRLSFCKKPVCEYDGSFLALLKCVDIHNTGAHERLVLGVLLAQPTSARGFVAGECISMTNHVFCTGLYRSDQSDALGHKATLSEKYFLCVVV